MKGRLVELLPGDVVRVRHDDLPIAVAVTDARGNFEVRSLEPAGRKKLGLRVGSASSFVCDVVRRVLRR